MQPGNDITQLLHGWSRGDRASLDALIPIVRPSSRPLASAPPLWAGAAPGWIGLYQVNLEVPASLSAGSFALSLTAHPLPSRPPFIGECSADFQGYAFDFVTLEVR